ncbi:autotransporter outer membrane beta-barrel domain-containing protein [Methylobacterium sp. ID0610]|uniref:autotransporter outer membrane beta-barrel domain-containing protein n=1 Tax=Methylobacterium carpenticola TaxID=3344827 RepID=UPI0036884BFF
MRRSTGLLLRAIVRTGVSLAALTAYARAEDVGGTRTSVVKVETGAAAGRFGGRRNNERAGPAGTGPDLNVSLSGTLLGEASGRAGPTVQIGSIGGAGGYAGGVGLLATPGGRGGAVTFLQSGSVREGIDTGAAGAMIDLSSTGGAGGTGFLGLRLNADAADGGAGGRVTATIARETATTAAKRAVIQAVSQGGAAGGRQPNRPDDVGRAKGGEAGSVSVTVSPGGELATTGSNAAGAILEARGGRGSDGNRRFVTGGDGGSASDDPAAPSVTFLNAGTVLTVGDSSPGAVLLSQGGDGGKGLGAGSRGGRGGAGGRIAADQTGDIGTTGEYAYGILAQSVGGAGGRGGSGIIGGDGGAGGGGGTVSITNTGTIATIGDNADAIVAQSVGGGRATDAFEARSIVPGGITGGGDGGTGRFLFFSTGGDGGYGGSGGKVTVRQGGRILTIGDDAIGVVAQSIGGGGGSGNGSKSYGAFLSVSLGGTGGGGGNGGQVEVLGAPGGRGAITTYGDRSYGILAQSVGGTGGVGGTAASNAAGLFGTVSLAVGGAGGKGGDGGTVTVENVSDIATAGFQSFGILAQSAGGGGGVAAEARAYAITTSLPQWPSVTMTLAVGGSGGDGGQGKAVSVTNDATVATSGAGAFGIAAVSIGGGGGIGGTARATTDLIGTSLDFATTAGVGGTGGGGGRGSDVTVLNRGTVETLGDYATAITAMSIGGGGGIGATGLTSAATGISWSGHLDSIVKSVELGKSFTYNLGIGGAGGGGGSGGSVTVTNEAAVRTQGSNAIAIVAQSVGGGGGNGGGFDGGGSGNLSLTINTGGQGGDGGAGGKVKVENGGNATIETSQAGSHGILAQSIGGGGGVGGSFAGEKKSYPDLIETTKLLYAKLTGRPSSDLTKQALAEGGDATPSTGTLLGQLFRDGYGAYKTYDGVKTLTSAAKQDPDARAGFKLTKEGLKPSDRTFLGGFKAAAFKIFKERFKLSSGTVLNGYKAATDKNVSTGEKVVNTGGYVVIGALQQIFIDRLKEFNQDILKSKKQPNPLNLGVTVGVGGTGGKGGAGAAVEVSNAGTISTEGDSSFGILAQSIGGGGGIGGASYTAGANILNLNGSVGGSGAIGGAGGAVTVTNTGAIETRGATSYGIFAQSVGGGGGIGGGSENSNGVSISANLAIGGAGGESSNGGAVTIKNHGTVTTSGGSSHGIVAQSVGGGGGTFTLRRAEPGAALDFAVPPTDADLANADALDALMKALGISASGGTAGYDNTTTILPKPSLNLSVGGSGGKGGNGGEVIVDQRGRITTSGDAAFGIFGQSIGAGGGFGANGSGAGILQLGAGIGGKGGVAGHGGTVTITVTGDSAIATSGFASHGIFAQSIGGGGGYGGTGAISHGLGSAPRFVRDDATSGNGNTITIATRNGSRLDIATSGKAAHGIFAQSLGGGGGAVTNADGEAVPVVSSIRGRIAAGGVGGDIGIDVKGNISATGENADAVLAQSGVQKADGTIDLARISGAIDVALSGAVQGGSGSGAAIRLDGSKAKTLTIAAGSTVSAVSGLAVQMTGSSIANKGRTGNTLTNNGAIFGNVDMNIGGGMGQNIVYNGVESADARIVLADRGAIGLGSGGRFENSGILDLGGVGKVARAELTGNFVQMQAGRLLVDVDPLAPDAALRSDHLTVTGTADLAGTVKPTVIRGLLPGDYTFLTAGSVRSATAAAPNTAIQSDSVPVSWAIVQSGNSLALRPTANFVSPLGMSLTDDQRSAAEALQELWNTGSRNQASVFSDFLAVRSRSSYSAALDELNPESIQDVLHGRAADARAGLTRANSCPAFVGTGTLQQEGDCVWGRVAAGHSAMFATPDDGAFKQSSLSYQGGMQTEFVPNWFLGLSGAYTRADLRDADKVTGSKTDAADVSLALKHQAGPWLFAVSTNLGYAWSDNLRSIDIGGSNWRALSKSEVFTAAGRLRASYQFLFDGWYIRPSAELDVLYTHSPAYSETGAQALNLDIRELNKTMFAFSPNVEIGGRIDLDDGRWIRPYGKFGLTKFSDDHFMSRASFQGSGGLGVFSTVSRIPDLVGDAGLGLQARFGNGLELVGEYQAQIGDRYLSHIGSVRLQARF